MYGLFIRPEQTYPADEYYQLSLTLYSEIAGSPAISEISLVILEKIAADWLTFAEASNVGRCKRGDPADPDGVTVQFLILRSSLCSRNRSGTFVSARWPTVLLQT